MYKPKPTWAREFVVVTIVLVVAVTAFAKNGSKDKKSDKEKETEGTPVIWVPPDDVKSRNLFYGPGGEKDTPHTVYTFEKEDMDGTSPKFTVRDENGVRWKVKLGPEARPETVASRLVWSVGYPTNEDYFVPELRVEKMPVHLKRGQQFVDNGTVHDARLKRYVDGEKKIGIWRWGQNPFLNTKELDGLKVMMALINNWDLKAVNNSIYREKHADDSNGPELVYMVSDLGASFGSTGLDWTQHVSKGNLDSFSNSKFIRKVDSQYIDFNVPTRSSIIHLFDPPEYLRRLRLEWIGKGIPRGHAQWIAQLLVQLTPTQVEDSFRAAGYTPEQVKSFSAVVEKRIAELQQI